MYTLKGTVWHLFCLACMVNCVSGQKMLAILKEPISDKITTVPRLFSEHSLQSKNKHQIMNVYTKWNCLIPILFGLVKY